MSADAGQSTEFKVFTYVLYVVIFVTSLLGNIIVCVAVWRKQGMRNVTNYFLVNLAGADLLFTLICIPFDVPLYESGCVWPFPGIFCKIIPPLQTACAFASVFTLTALSFSRGQAIAHPMRHQLNLTSAKRYILTIWLVAFAFVIPYMLVQRMDEDAGLCREDWPEPKVAYRTAYTFLIFTTQFLLPFCIIFCCHCKICAELKNNNANVALAVQPERARETKQVFRMVTAATILFAVCTLPNHLAWIALEALGITEMQCNKWIIMSNIGVFANSALNPVVYTTFNEKYRKAFREILGCKDESRNYQVVYRRGAVRIHRL